MRRCVDVGFHQFGIFPPPLMFDLERCQHNIPWTIPCPICIANALEEIKLNRDLLTDDLPPMKPYIPAEHGDAE